MSYKLNFITNDESIRSNLSQSITQSSHSRHEVSRLIGQDFCRNLHNLVETLREHMMKEENTIIFVNGGHRVLGLIIFRIIRRPVEAIMVEVICVPETGERGIGTQLLNKVKEVAENVSLPIYLFSVDESIEFYRKNGFEKRKGGFYVFSPSTTSTTSGGKRKIRTRRKMIRKTRRHHRT
jgi:predicted N-acetyltransferase YhbS